jgi:VIT1/CCC1 family predicted Fe2+/Mn2+ transporter
MTRPDLSEQDLPRPELHSGHRPVSGGLARAAVFGINDGLVSNVSLILGFAGSGVDSSIVRLAGLAGAIAGGISMAAGEWIGPERTGRARGGRRAA